MTSTAPEPPDDSLMRVGFTKGGATWAATWAVPTDNASVSTPSDSWIWLRCSANVLAKSS